MSSCMFVITERKMYICNNSVWCCSSDCIDSLTAGMRLVTTAVSTICQPVPSLHTHSTLVLHTHIMYTCNSCRCIISLFCILVTIYLFILHLSYQSLHRSVYSLTSLKWLTVAMPLQETRERLERETRERLERD